MRYGAIKKRDIANGIGVRVTLFVSGCTHHCPGCFQPETWNFDYGEDFTEATEAELMTALDSSFIRGLTLLGGEPFEPDNQRALLPLLRSMREKFGISKDIWAFTGCQLEDLEGSGAPAAVRHFRCEVTDELLSMIDVLVDGPFVEAQKDISLKFRGSSNQRLIDMNETRKTGAVVLWDT